MCLADSFGKTAMRIPIQIQAPHRQAFGYFTNYPKMEGGISASDEGLLIWRWHVSCHLKHWIIACIHINIDVTLKSIYASRA